MQSLSGDVSASLIVWVYTIKTPEVHEGLHFVLFCFLLKVGTLQSSHFSLLPSPLQLFFLFKLLLPNIFSIPPPTYYLQLYYSILIIIIIIICHSRYIPLHQIPVLFIIVIIRLLYFFFILYCKNSVESIFVI